MKVDLNNICCQIHSGDNSSVKTFFNNYKVKAVIEGAVKKIRRQNPEYELGLIHTTAQTAVWDEIRRNYKFANDESKGDNLVLSYIKSITYRLLFNWIQDEKKLKWHYKEGYRKRYGTIVSLDTEPVAMDKNLHEIIPSPKPNAEQILINNVPTNLIHKILNKLVRTKQVSQMDMFVILLRFQEEKTYEEIIEILKSQFSIKYKKRHISSILKTGQNKIRQNLESLPYSKEDFLDLFNDYME